MGYIKHMGYISIMYQAYGLYFYYVASIWVIKIKIMYG